MILRTFTGVVLVASVAAGAACRRDPQILKRQYMESGDSYFAKKNYAEAIIQYRNAVTQDATFGEARFKLGIAYEEAGDLKNALREQVRAADLMPDSVDVQLHAGKLLVAAGQYPEAKARAIAALAKDPKNVNGLIVMGNALAGLKDMNGAISQIEDAVDTAPQLVFGYANLGLLNLKKGDRPAAEDAFTRATEVNPKSLEAHLNLGNFYWAAGRRSDAEKEFKTALEIDPKSPDVNKILAAYYMLTEQRSTAEPYLKAFAAASPTVTSKLALADFYIQQGRTADAVVVLEPLSKEKDGSRPANLRLAAIDFKAERREKAYATIEELLKTLPSDPQTLDAKTRFLMADQKFDEAEKIARVAIVANPRAVTSYFLLGQTLRAKGSFDDAITAFQKVLELAPAATAAQIQLTSLYMVRGDSKAALEFAGQVLKKQPQSGLAHLLMGQALFQSGNLTAAEAELLPLSKLNPKSSEIQISLGRLYGAKNDLVRARQAFKQALELEPKSLLALDGVVTIDIVAKHNDEARKTLEEQLASRSDDSSLLFLAANSYLRMGDAPKSEALFRRVLQLNPSNVEAYGRLAGLYLSQHRLDQAKAELDEAARHQSNPVTATTLIGVILTMQDKTDQARKQYQRALALDPKAVVAANNLALDYAERGEDLDTALKLAQIAKAGVPDNGAISDTLGWVYYKKGLADLAVRALREGAKQNPNDPTIHYHLGLAYLKAGDRLQAKQSLQRALTLNPTFKAADEARRVLTSIQG